MKTGAVLLVAVLALACAGRNRAAVDEAGDPGILGEAAPTSASGGATGSTPAATPEGPVATRDAGPARADGLPADAGGEPTDVGRERPAPAAPVDAPGAGPFAIFAHLTPSDLSTNVGGAELGVYLNPAGHHASPATLTRIAGALSLVLWPEGSLVVTDPLIVDVAGDHHTRVLLTPRAALLDRWYAVRLDPGVLAQSPSQPLVLPGTNLVNQHVLPAGLIVARFRGGSAPGIRFVQEQVNDSAASWQGSLPTPPGDHTVRITMTEPVAIQAAAQALRLSGPAAAGCVMPAITTNSKLTFHFHCHGSIIRDLALSFDGGPLSGQSYVVAADHVFSDGTAALYHK